MTEVVPAAQENLAKGGQIITEVSHSFKELDFFRGRFLRHIYDHKRMIDKEWFIEQDIATQDFKNAPPIFSAHEQRKVTLNR